ncbi:hypothetical protein U8527_04380 [Kordia algicida OT-1]|uniref:Gliding motility-associated protein GldM N-terminal domain-containing protein n=1 Tax=Kordia algicida OT-1 TaxID=391587 RepID=A9DPY7_9FLAO|nr:hypothetical protein [Kordia algicida]EDP97559.1 hypothetical protein KAOT1_20392 [Kordia algicida OT-1]
MNPKGIIITFFIISLVLIGMMFLIVDVRNNPIADDFTTIENEFEKINSEETAKINTDSITATLKSQNIAQSQELEKFNILTEDALANIKQLQEQLFPGGIEAHDLGESDRIKENNTLFFKENGEPTKIATEFTAKLDAFENNIRVLIQLFPEVKTVEATVRDQYTKGLSWLDYNFKDFPAIASYVKLKTLTNNIKSKREAIFMAVLKK